MKPKKNNWKTHGVVESISLIIKDFADIPWKTLSLSYVLNQIKWAILQALESPLIFIAIVNLILFPSLASVGVILIVLLYAFFTSRWASYYHSHKSLLELNLYLKELLKHGFRLKKTKIEDYIGEESQLEILKDSREFGINTDSSLGDIFILIPTKGHVVSQLKGFTIVYDINKNKFGFYTKWGCQSAIFLNEAPYGIRKFHLFHEIAHMTRFANVIKGKKIITILNYMALTMLLGLNNLWVLLLFIPHIYWDLRFVSKEKLDDFEEFFCDAYAIGLMNNSTDFPFLLRCLSKFVDGERVKNIRNIINWKGQKFPYVIENVIRYYELNCVPKKRMRLLLRSILIVLMLPIPFALKEINVHYLLYLSAAFWLLSGVGIRHINKLGIKKRELIEQLTDLRQKDNAPKKEKEKITEDELEDIKKQLTVRYKARLRSKLVNPLKIGSRRPSLNQIGEDMPDFHFTKLDEFCLEISAEHKKNGGCMIIIGESSSGKTNLLRDLTFNILVNEKQTLPLQLNLASWKNSYLSLTEWLEEILPIELAIGKGKTKKIIEDFPLILLLDELDSISIEYRRGFLNAIKKHDASNIQQYIITSRVQEYTEISKHVPEHKVVEIKVLVQPKMKIRDFFNPEKLDFTNLNLAIQKNLTLQRVVSNNFYFDALQFLFKREKKFKGLNFSAMEVIGLQKEIKKQFVDVALNKVASNNYSKSEVEHWLSFLAYNMNKHNLSCFELADLQYSWNDWHWTSLIFPILISILVNGIKMGILWGLFGGGLGLGIGYTLGQPTTMLYVGIFMGVVGTLLFCLCFFFYALVLGKTPNIETKEFLPRGLFKKHFLSQKNLKTGLIIGILIGLFSQIQYQYVMCGIVVLTVVLVLSILIKAVNKRNL